MKKYLLRIRIGNKELLPILIYDGGKVNKASSMKTLSCIVNTLQNRLVVPVEYE